MKFSFTFNAVQSQHMAQLIRGTGAALQEPVTQAEITQFLATCFRSALSLDPDMHGGDLREIGDAVIEDINRGGWSFIGQPPANK